MDIKSIEDILEYIVIYKLKNTKINYHSKKLKKNW